MLLEDVSTPVVVLGCFRHGGLAIVRSLGRLGVPVYAIHADRWTPALFSKYCRETFLWDVHTAQVEDSLRFLKQVHRSIGRRSILIPTSDIGAMFVADHAERLAEWFTFPDQDPKVVRSMCNKREMYHLAKKHDVPTPETAFPRSSSDVRDYLRNARLPVLIKPMYSDVSRMVLVHTAGELLQRYDAMQNPARPNLMLQEYIPGGDEMTWTFNGYFDRSGECNVAFTGRKLRNYPAYFGQASLGMCVGNDHVAQTTVAFMKAIGYRGPLDLGYRYDARDGRYKVNDINPRIGSMFRLFTAANGMDVARALYQDMTGQAVLPATTQEGRKWIVEDCDWIAALRYCRDGRLTLKGWRDSLRGVQETSYLAADDPWPVAGVVLTNLRRLLARLPFAKRVMAVERGAKAQMNA
jgi:predicted ATP-grasp superfamily ATP-dependent carboligase